MAARTLAADENSSGSVMNESTADFMDGYDDTSYGRGFADVYDDWYADVTDVAATVQTMCGLASGGSVLELGVGTGRLAIPLADAGLAVTGIDSSDEMLAKLAERDPTGRVTAILGDMVTDLPDGPFDAALVAYNTIFNLRDASAQQQCFHEVASRLVPAGHFVVETFVPGPHDDTAAESDVSVRSMTVDRVVLSVSQNDPTHQQAFGQFIEITEAGGVRLRPWSIRWSTLQQLDEMASSAGFDLVDRYADMTHAAFDEDGPQQVSVYRLVLAPAT